MEELIKIKDIGYSEPEIDENNTEDYYDDTSEETVHIYERSISLGDIIMFQFVICVIIIIALIVMNLIKPEFTKDFLHNCHININNYFDYKQEILDIIEKVSKIINVKI